MPRRLHHNQTCVYCGSPRVWRKFANRYQSRFFCRCCQTYFTVTNQTPVQRAEGNAKWRALSRTAHDNYEWTGTLAQLLAMLDAEQRNNRHPAHAGKGER